jgi:hypothetical protein
MVLEEGSWLYENLFCLTEALDLLERYQRVTPELCGRKFSSTPLPSSGMMEALASLRQYCSFLKQAYGRFASMTELSNEQRGLQEVRRRQR